MTNPDDPQRSRDVLDALRLAPAREEAALNRAHCLEANLCPGCQHDVALHYEFGCLVLAEDDENDPDATCVCLLTRAQIAAVFAEWRSSPLMPA